MSYDKQKHLKELLEKYIEFKNFYNNLQNVTSFEITTYIGNEITGKHKRELVKWDNIIKLNEDYFFLSKVRDLYLETIKEFEEELGVENKEKIALEQLSKNTDFIVELEKITEKYKKCKELNVADADVKYRNSQLIIDILIFVELLKIKFEISDRYIEDDLKYRIKSIKEEFTND